MKKYLITFLAVLTCIFTAAAFGCKKDGGKTKKPPEYTVEFTPTENLEYVCDALEDGENTITVKSGTVVSFEVVVPELYAVPSVYSNGTRINATEGVYSVTVNNDIVITTGAVRLPDATLSGAGTSESPVQISTISDYVYVAEEINSGSGAYNSLYYELANDIDFHGLEIPVMGDYSTPYSYFMGYFNGNGFTLSNFKIKTSGTMYVGLFGFLSSSTTDPNLGTITNLNIDNFTIEAQAASGNSVFAGSIVGYSVAASVSACSATNGSITVSADDAAFSYVGGAVGLQNSATTTSGSSINMYPATTSYVYTDVSVIGARGAVYAAGGVIGYVISEHEQSISSVINSYAVGEVIGGVCSGGVAGYLSEYSSMANCYALGDVDSYSNFNANTNYADTYAGGLVGYIGRGAVITDSFANNGYVGGASAGGSVHKGALVGGEEVSVVTDKGVVFNCYSGDDVKVTEDFFKNTLYWQECDWIITDNGSYPEINKEESQVNTFTVKFVYNTDNNSRTVDGKTSRDLRIKLDEEFYAPMPYFYDKDRNISGEDFGNIVNSDLHETSYGFFFDEEFTQKVPYGFIPTRNITLYVGFADYNAVSGTYYLVSAHSKREIKLALNADGSYTYNDGIEFTDTYSFNGTKLIFNNALFARLSDSIPGSYDSNGTPIARPDQNYGIAKFAAIVEDNGLKIYDDTFFTEGTYLIANRTAISISGEWYSGTDKYVFYTDLTGKLNNQSFTYELSSGVLTIHVGGATKTGSVSGNNVTVEGVRLSKYDSFKGVWEIASNVSRKYEFDGMGGWTYKVKGATVASGSYSVDGSGVANLSGTYTAQAELDASGLLLVKKNGNDEYFAKQDSFSGVWVDLEHNILIYIYGFGNSLMGEALMNEGGATSKLTYVLDGFFDGDGKLHITLLDGWSLFGYLTSNEDGSFTGTFFSASTATYLNGYDFYLLDTLEGDWIGEGSFGEIEFNSLNFNGLGLYGNGSVSLNGGEGEHYTLDENFDATFGDYTITFDDEKDVITVTFGSETVELYRKDEISGYVLIANIKLSDIETIKYKYVFNGGGNLSKGGKLTITDETGDIIAELGYKNNSGSIKGRDLIIDLYSSFRGTEAVGTITISNNKFQFDYNGKVAALPKQVALTIDNPLLGTWRASILNMGDYYIGNSTITIDELDLTNTASGYFLDMSGRITFTYLPDYNCFMVPYQTGEMTSPEELYLILLSEGNMAISTYNVLTVGDNLMYCARGDGFFGDWHDDTQSVIKTFGFDGMADSLYTAGVAWNENGEIFLYTRRFGKYYLWSWEGTVAYTIELRGDTESASFVYYSAGSFRNYITLNYFDLDSCILKAEDSSSLFEFYLTYVKVNGEEKGYTITSVNGNYTELVIYDSEGSHDSGARYKVNHAQNTIEAVV